MKKLYTMMMMAMMGMMAMSFTSCETDEYIANTLEGTWKGNMYIHSDWAGSTYNATYSEITFLKDPYTYSEGNGYWVDYYSDAPWDYVANHIEWSVEYGIIKVYFVEDHDYMEIRDYRLNSDHFYGTIYDGGHAVDFELYNTSRPYYNNYSWGYDSWYDDYSWSRTRGADADSTKVIEKPRRFVAK